ncbi:MAG TPA: ATP-binding protein [Gemmatimonadales bacterium]
MQPALAQRLDEAISADLAAVAGTRREIHLPRIPGKAHAVIGMRRAGKTTLLWQCLRDRLDQGRPRESLVLLGLEDDRLAGLDVAHLDWLLEEYFRRFPALRHSERVTLCLDEVQTVPGWERFARRVVDSELVDLFLSGSSARLLSREVATAFRGRVLEVLVHPFSFREALRHADKEPAAPWERLPPAERSALDHELRRYLELGGFAEAQGLDARDRGALFRSYVDATVLRDVIERHAVSNPVALRWMQRQLLSTPAGAFSVQKLFGVMRSQGIAVGKDTLHEYLSHLEDSFLIRTVSLHTASERRRMVNPRKVYPVDPGLIGVYARTGPQTGHALETAVLLELERRGYEVGYLKTGEDWEVDFFASGPGRETLLIQVTADARNPETLEREVRPLVSALEAHAGAPALLVTLDSSPPPAGLPAQVQWWPAARWLLEEM